MKGVRRSSAIARFAGDRQPNFLCRFSLLERFHRSLEINEIPPQGRWRKDNKLSCVGVLPPEDG